MDHVRDGNQHLHHKFTKNIVMLFIFSKLFYIELTLNNWKHVEAQLEKSSNIFFRITR